jgi:NhaA family Na+:H+ antiporter
MAGSGAGDAPPIQLPAQPIHRLVGPLARFMHIEAASGGVLLVATAIALILANSPLASGFLGFWKTSVGFEIGDFAMHHSLKHWINDGLMAVFFFVIGLEVKRELVIGELRDVRRAALPIAAAIGGMIAPAGVYLALQSGQPGAAGWGIPMATDIAFVVGCLAVLGSRVPQGFRVLLLSLAIADDIGAILVIAIGYTETIHWGALALGIAGLGVVPILARVGVRSFGIYILFGTGIWLAFHESGIHATIAGVALGLLTPSNAHISEGTLTRFTERVQHILTGGEFQTLRDRASRVRTYRAATREVVSPLEYLEGLLHPWVGFAIMPVFALANAGVEVHLSAFGDEVALAVAAGLLLGKPLGILSACWLAVRAGVASLPDGVGWASVAGGGFLAGIGFTMALFIGGLALEGEMLDAAKVGILGASAIAAAAGLAILLRSLPASAARSS